MPPEGAARRTPVLTFAHLAALPGLAHAVSTRAGGVSAGPFAALNLGLHVGDDPAAVLENRARLCATLGLSLEDIVVGAQVHGGEVAVVGRADRGRGARDHADAVPGVDALVNDAPGVGLLVLAADCVPLVLVDPVRGAVGVAHAGWRGVAVGVAGRAVGAMAAAFGCAPRDLRAGIGPAIGAADYVVGPDVVAALGRGWGAAAGAWLGADAAGRRTLDLAGAVRDQLVGAGLDARHVATMPHSTAADTARFYSHRAEGGRTGRLGALVALRR